MRNTYMMQITRSKLKYWAVVTLTNKVVLVEKKLDGQRIEVMETMPVDFILWCVPANGLDEEDAWRLYRKSQKEE